MLKRIKSRINNLNNTEKKIIKGLLVTSVVSMALAGGIFIANCI